MLSSNVPLDRANLTSDRRESRREIKGDSRARIQLLMTATNSDIFPGEGRRLIHPREAWESTTLNPPDEPPRGV
jgi:hypothetical protein